MRLTHHTSTLRWVLAASITLAVAGLAAALPGEEGAPFSIDWHTIDGGGGECTDGTYTLTGTVGQHDVGVLTGGNFSLSGGFWQAGEVDPACFGDCGDSDGTVGTTDLLALLGQWGGPGGCDLDDSGDVGVPDLLALLGVWGSCP